MKERYYVLYDSPVALHPDAMSTDPWVEAETGEEAREIMKERVARRQAEALAKEALKKEGKPRVKRGGSTRGRRS